MVVVEEDDVEVNVDGSAKTPGTVTVMSTTSVDVDVPWNEVDESIGVDVFKIVSVWSVVG